MTAGGWSVERLRGGAGEHHARPLPEPPARRAWLFRAERPALVLGSAQPADHVDEAAAHAAGVAVVRRSSGGGAVLVQPDTVAWFDLLVPREDPLWDDDVGRASWWLGETWAAVLGALDLRAEVHRGGLTRPTWSDRICFAGLGAGEVTVGGRKVVGISQRRARGQARFQCAALLAWRPTDLVDLLALEAGQRRACLAAVADRATGLADLLGNTVALSVADLENRLLSALP